MRIRTSAKRTKISCATATPYLNKSSAMIATSTPFRLSITDNYAYVQSFYNLLLGPNPYPSKVFRFSCFFL